MIEKSDLIALSSRLDAADDADVGALYDEIVGMLNVEPDDHRLRYLYGAVANRARQFGLAKSVLEPMLRTHGNWGALRMTYGLVLDAIGEYEQALEHYSVAERDKLVTRDNLAANRASAYLKLGRYDDAYRTLITVVDNCKTDDVIHNVQTNMAFACIALGDLEQGWRWYEGALGTPQRGLTDFGVPRWDGSKDARVLVYPEQGLGDEIMYLGMLPELIAVTAAVAVECDPRLSLLFKRSFPGVKVAGSRHSKGPKPWVEEFAPTHQLAMGSLPKFFRPTKDDFKKQPQGYLKENGAYAAMYESLVHTTAGNSQPYGNREIIGIAWSGGRYNTQEKRREIPLSAFAPLIEKYPNAIFVSLQYRKGAAEEIELSGLPIQHHEFATGLGASYDHTAAMIAACTRIIATDTTAIHAAGAMGVRVDCLLNTPCMWVHAPWHNDQSAWYPSVKLRRKPEDMEWPRYINHLVSQGLL